jgi:hypothetical protein
LLVGRICAGRRIDLRKADAQPARAGEQHRQIRRIHLRQIREHVEQPSQAAGNRRVHTLPDDVLRLRVGARIAAIVENLDETDSRRVEMLRDRQRMIVAALLHLVPLERGPHENRDDQLSLLAGHLRNRHECARAGTFSSRSDQDDDRVRSEQGLDL